jgi:hypothetical protein
MLTAAAAFTLGAASPAQADLSIAKSPTKNVSCTGGTCVATARHAIMNLADLQNLLASRPAVSLDAGPASAIAIDAALTWTSNATLSLTAQSSLTVNRPVTVAGSGGVIIQTADGGLSFAPKASLSFWSLTSALTINNVPYRLAGDLKTLSYDLAHQGATAGALASDYDASVDGAYSGSPIGYLEGHQHLEGLGHAISHLTVGLGSGLADSSDGRLTNLHLTDAVIYYSDVSGGVVGRNRGIIDHVSVSGILNGRSGWEIGGLVVENDSGGTIRNSWAKVKIPLGGYVQTGGLAAVNSGTISNSWADGTVRGMGVATDAQGGMVGFNGGRIENSYSLADTRFCAQCKFETAHGGLIGETWATSKVVSSYAAGRTAPPRGNFSRNTPCDAAVNVAGAVVGCDAIDSAFRSTYWVTDSSRHNPKQPAGNKREVAGVAGLTEAQLKAALPPGLDPKIWGQSPNINNGYPYLLSNPPE